MDASDVPDQPLRTRLTELLEGVGPWDEQEHAHLSTAAERIGRDSARDHPTVIEVPAAFIREHSSAPAPDGTAEAGEKAEGAVADRHPGRAHRPRPADLLP